jgi:hypothetical protein
MVEGMLHIPHQKENHHKKTHKPEKASPLGMGRKFFDRKADLLFSDLIELLEILGFGRIQKGGGISSLDGIDGIHHLIEEQFPLLLKSVIGKNRQKDGHGWHEGQDSLKGQGTSVKGLLPTFFVVTLGKGLPDGPRSGLEVGPKGWIFSGQSSMATKMRQAIFLASKMGPF